MKKTFLHLFLLTFCLVFLLTCKKEEKTLPPIVPLSKVFKDWAYYKKGSWWVYEDSASKEKDSVLAISDTIKIGSLSDNHGRDVIRRTEDFDYISQHYPSNKIYRYQGGSLSSDTMWEGHLNYLLNESEKDINGNDFATIGIFWLDTIKKPSSFCCDNYYCCNKIITIYESLSINNTIYKNVIKTYYLGGIPNVYSETHRYFVKKVGIIRKEVNIKKNKQDPDNWQIWNLIKYHIIQ